MKKDIKDIVFFTFAILMLLSAGAFILAYVTAERLFERSVGIANQINQHQKKNYNCYTDTLLKRLNDSVRDLKKEIQRLKEGLFLLSTKDNADGLDPNKGLRFMETLSQRQEELTRIYPDCKLTTPDNWGFPRQMPEGQDIGQYFPLLDTEAEVLKKICSNPGTTLESLILKLPSSEQLASVNFVLNVDNFGAFFALLSGLPYLKTPMFYLSQVVAGYNVSKGFSLNIKYVPNDFFCDIDVKIRGDKSKKGQK